VRVVLLNQYYAPDEAATAQLLADLGAGLADAGHSVHAVCSRRSYADPDHVYPAHETIGGVEVYRTWSTGFGRGRVLGRVLDYVTYLIGACWILLLRARPDVVISLSTPPMVAVLGWLAARVRRAVAVYWVMDVYPDLAFELGALRPRALSGRLFAALSRFVLRRSDRVVALGETMAARLRRGGAARVDVIHNWADGDAIRPARCADNPLRRQWGWQDRFVVLYSGNMGMAHEFDTVIECAERLKGDPRVLFAFVGAGPRRGELEAAVRDRELPNVELRSYVERDRLGDSLTAADVHLVTLRDRMPGLLVPSKIYGILAAGRPTIYVGPDEGEIATIVAEGRCGARVALGDVSALCDCVRRYASGRELCHEQGRRARELFDRRFTKAHGLAAFGRVIRSGIGEEASSA